MSTDLTRTMTDAVAIAINKAILASVAEKPSSPLINLEDVTIEQIKEFLRAKHTSSWSIFSISSNDSMEKAAHWFQRELGLLHSFLYRVEEYDSPSS